MSLASSSISIGSRKVSAVEAAMEGDDSPQPARLQAIIAELCGFLNALVAEETGEILDDAESGASPLGLDRRDILIMAAGAAGAASSPIYAKPGVRKCRNSPLRSSPRSKHSQGDQALLDLAYRAVDKCMGMNGLLFAERSHLTKARDALKAAGAASSEESTVDTARNPEVLPPMVRPPAREFRPGENSTIDTSRRPPSAARRRRARNDRGGAGQAGVGPSGADGRGARLHRQVTDGASCAADKVGARHSRQTLSG